LDIFEVASIRPVDPQGLPGGVLMIEGRGIDAVSAKPLIRKLCGVGNTAAFSLLPTPITSAT
jgi:hypothetical protein